jgi:hypothetical protein
MSTYAENEARAQAIAEWRELTQLKDKVDVLINDARRLQRYSAAWLVEPRTTLPGMRPKRDVLLRMLVQVGAVAIGEEEG